MPPVPSEIATARAGLYRIEKDIPQGRVCWGCPRSRRDDPDAYALEVMNEILGGSGFTSRITRTVRSNEGLAYQAGPGCASACITRARSAPSSSPRAAPWPAPPQLVLEEIRKIREGAVTDEELDTVKRNLIETFPSNFESKGQAMAIFAADEYTRRDPSYWQTYRDRIRAVTAADVQRVARQHLAPDKLVILVVGNQKEIDLGDDKTRQTLAELAAGGFTRTLPLRDPLTMKRPAHKRECRPGRALFFLKASTNSFSSMGLLLLMDPMMKSFADGVYLPLQTSRNICLLALKKQSASAVRLARRHLAAVLGERRPSTSRRRPARSNTSGAPSPRPSGTWPAASRRPWRLRMAWASPRGLSSRVRCYRRPAPADPRRERR